MATVIGTSAEPPPAPYTLLRELGRGGMGVVYLAEDHARGDRCAVKLLHRHLTQDETMVARFQTEARTASAIDHPAIVQIRGDISRLADGQWYCVMEYIDGLTLAQFMAQRGPLSLALILEIIAPLCDALDQAHAAGILHRDLKPDNVMVMLRADRHVPKLLDFGIAKLIDEPGVTRPGSAPGTTAYMAPEQLRGDAVDRRCDIYALGVLVYQMITGGSLPYDAPDGALYHTQMTEPPIDPRRRCEAVPAEVVGPLLAAIHVQAAQRPATAGGFALALARSLVGQTPQTDGMAILQGVAPRLLVTTNLHETLRAPGLSGTRGAGVWSYQYGPILGKGGFGEVLRGTKLGADGFRLPVAIKRILREHAETPAFVELFHQEARTAALLGAHHNIVKVLDHATDPEGRLYIAMEFIDGVDLEKLRRAGPIPPAVTIYVISEVLEGLGHAHHLPLPGMLLSAEELAARSQVRGIVHRDMSHDNVMISWHGAVKVMDFGIAKLRQATVAPGSAMIKGKPAYFSPEQANAGVSLDGRSDLFAIGIMLWELLTGYRLFERDSLEATLAAVLFDPIPRPIISNPSVPPDLERVTLRLLQRDPDARYQTASDAIAALGACLAASRTAKTELQHLLRLRFPESAAHSPVPLPSPASERPPGIGLAAPGVPRPVQNTTNSHAIGQSIAGPAAPGSVRRIRRVAAAMVAVGAVGAAAIVVARHRPDATSAEPAHRAAPPVDDADSTAIRPVPSPPPTTPRDTPPASASTSVVAMHRSATLVIATEPSDALLRIEGASTLIAAGRSPLTISVPQGAHVQIHAEASGFVPTERPITIGAQDRQSVMLALAPIAPPMPHPQPAVQAGPPPATPPVTKPRRSPSKPTAPDGDQIME